MYNKSNKAKIAVLASGRGSNFVAIQKAIDRGEIAARIAVLICDKPKAKVIEAAREFGIDVSIVDSAGLSNDEFDKKLVAELKGYAIDLILLAGFMKIVGRPLLENFPGKIINIHPSLLPSFKGLNAQRQAIEYGAKISGCTVHFIDEGVDTGPIILQSSVPVLDNDTEETLSARILEEEHRIYPEGVRLFVEKRLRIDGRRVIIEESSC